MGCFCKHFFLFLLLFHLTFTSAALASTRKILITDRNRHRFTELSQVNIGKIHPVCFRGQNVVRIGKIRGQVFLTPLKTLRRKSARKQRSKLYHSTIAEAAAQCRKTGSNDPELPMPDPNPPTVAIPELALWEGNMISFGKHHCQSLKEDNFSFDSKLAATYYDAEWIFYQIGDYTKDRSWDSCAAAAERVYRDAYVLPNNGVVPGYWNFTHGLTRDYLSSGDQNSQQAAILLSQAAAYAPDWTPLSWTENANMSREVAYAIMSYLNAEQVGAARRARTEELLTQALEHLDQWFVSRNAEYIRPFMFALTAQALISYAEQVGGNSKIIPALSRGVDWIWDHTWLSKNRAFMYTDRNVSSGGMEPAPDLNLLIAPVFAWLWHKTGEERFRDRADQIFAGGVSGAWLNNPKQFNQNYRWSFDYVKWRLAPSEQ